MVTFEVTTQRRTEFVDITNQVSAIVSNSRIGSGICVVWIPHTTAAVMVNEGHDPAVLADIERALTRMVPAQFDYAHREGNADAHIKAAIVGTCQSLPIASNQLALGRWQRLFFCEFDGPRRRQVTVRLIKDS